jgi:lysozyme family protein
MQKTNTQTPTLVTKMLTEDFCRAFEFLARNEGGFVNHPADKGGATKYGVTLTTLRRWRKDMTLGDYDVAALTRDEAKQIYYKEYWCLLRLDEVSKLAVATAVFDAGILFGPVVAVRAAQRALLDAGSNVKVDGLLGPKTVQALSAASEQEWISFFTHHLNARISEIIKFNPRLAVFEAGWRARIGRYLNLL